MVHFVKGGIARPKDLVDGLGAIRHVDILRQEKSQNGSIAWPLLLDIAWTRACIVGVDKIWTYQHGSPSTYAD